MAQTRYYVFAVLPFRLASACYAFTKLLKPLIRYWQGQGLRAKHYLDDGIVAVSGKETTKAASCRVQENLAKAAWLGILINAYGFQLGKLPGLVSSWTWTKVSYLYLIVH